MIENRYSGPAVSIAAIDWRRLAISGIDYKQKSL
jgi:hypothetical protein